MFRHEGNEGPIITVVWHLVKPTLQCWETGKVLQTGARIIITIPSNHDVIKR